MWRRCLLLLAIANSSCAFIVPAQYASSTPRRALALNALGMDSNEPVPRRHVIIAAGSAALVGWQVAAFADSETTKVLVLGGTGFVGSRVVEQLQNRGVAVVATSRDGRDGTVALNVLDVDVEDKVRSLSAGCQAVVSCIGAIGTPYDSAVNAASGLAAKGAKSAGVQRFVYIGVAPEVVQAVSGVSQFKGYFEGKDYSRKSILASFGDSGAILIDPTFIYGGDDFGVSPPRVAGFYGQFIEGLLASPPFRLVEGILPKGNLIQVALEAPVSVDAVAGAAVAGALGRISSTTILNSYDKIQAAYKLLQ